MRATIETERLILRNLSPDDYEAAFKWCGDPEVTRYMIYPVYTRAIDVKTLWLDTLDPDMAKQYDLGIVLKETGELIGAVTITYKPNKEAWVIGYNMRRDHWGKGIMPEAAQALLAYVQEREEVKILEGAFAVENPKSGRVMEKLGMTYYGDTEFDKLDGSAHFKAYVFRRVFD